MTRAGQGPRSIVPIEPSRCSIEGIVILERVLHVDGRGFLVETLRNDDVAVSGAEFHMSYSSLTMPGAARDEDRWHYHHRQKDRYVIVTGQMLIALYDARPDSPTAGQFAVLRCSGARQEQIEGARRDGRRFDAITYLIVIPEMVYHTLKNPGPEPALLQNYPTQLYDATDEGRALFTEVPIQSLAGLTFSWGLVTSSL